MNHPEWSRALPRGEISLYEFLFSNACFFGNLSFVSTSGVRHVFAVVNAVADPSFQILSTDFLYSDDAVHAISHFAHSSNLPDHPFLNCSFVNCDSILFRA